MSRSPVALTAVALLAATSAAAAPGWRQAADQACARRAAAEARLEPEDPEDRAQLLRFFRGVAGAQRTLVVRLDALRPPQADRAAFRRLRAAEAAAAPLLDEAARLLARGVSPQQVDERVGPRVDAASRRIRAAAVALRLAACADG